MVFIIVYKKVQVLSCVALMALLAVPRRVGTGDTFREISFTRSVHRMLNRVWVNFRIVRGENKKKSETRSEPMWQYLCIVLRRERTLALGCIGGAMAALKARRGASPKAVVPN